MHATDRSSTPLRPRRGRGARVPNVAFAEIVGYEHETLVGLAFPEIFRTVEDRLSLLSRRCLPMAKASSTLTLSC